MEFVYQATKIITLNTTRSSLFVGCYSSLEKFEEVLKKHSNGYIKVPVGPEGMEPSYYNYFLTDKEISEMPEEELYENTPYIVVEKIKINEYDPVFEEAMFWW